MKDSDIDKAIELRNKRDEASKHANKVYNYVLASAPESYKFAMAALDIEEYNQVRNILVNACRREEEKYSAELQKL